jgi:hypothetical protein
MRIIATIATIAAATFTQAYGQDAGKVMTGYSTMDYEAGYMESSFDGKVEKMTEGVKIILKSDDPSKPPLPISSREVSFTWPEKGGNQPSKIILEGKVVVEHPEASVHAEKAEWDFEKGLLTFTGSPVMKSPKMPDGIEAQKVVLNFNDGRVQVFGGHAKNARITGLNDAKTDGKANAKPDGKADAKSQEKAPAKDSEPAKKP